MAHGGEVNPNLMGSACLGKDLKKSETVKPLNDLPSGDRCFPFFSSCRHSFSLTGVSSDGRIDQTFLFTKLPTSNSQVNLLYRTILKLPGQMMISFVIFGNDHDTGGILI